MPDDICELDGGESPYRRRATVHERDGREVLTPHVHVDARMGFDRVVPTLLLSARVAGDLLFAAAAPLPQAVRELGGTSELVSASVYDASGLSVSFDLAFFAADPAVNPAGRFLGVVGIDAGDYATLGGDAFASPSPSRLGIVLRDLVGTGILYVVGIARENVQFAAATDLTFSFGYRRD